MTAAPATAAPTPATRQVEAFPRLTPAQIARIEPHGRRRRLEPGEILGEAGEPGEDWGFCYVENLFIEPAPRPAR